MNISRIPDRRENRPKPVANQSWEVALRPGAAGKTSKPASGKCSFMFVYLFWALTEGCSLFLFCFASRVAWLNMNPKAPK